jgi:hypothetical protein
MNAVVPLPIEIDPRPCGLCGLTVDRHQMVEDGEGPEFFCAAVPIDDLTLDELERRAELRRQEEVAAIVARWELSDPRPDESSRAPRRREPYAPAQSTIDAFRHVLGLDDPDYLARWLGDRPAEVPHLFKIWKSAAC